MGRSVLKGDDAIELQGPAGLLEARVMGASVLASGELQAPLVAVVCHPHSLHGGTLQNKVVSTLCRGFREIDIPSVRFNFRGVGKSAGAYSEGPGETEDLLAVVEWVRTQCPDARILLAGFSFGAFVASRGARALEDAGRTPEGLILVAPAVVNFDFSSLLPVQAPTLVVQGGADEVVDPDRVSDWVASLHPSPTLVWMGEAGHFFHGMLPGLKSEVLGFIERASLAVDDQSY